MPESRRIIIVYRHPNGMLGEWEVGAPVGWDDMNGAARRQWGTRLLRRKDSSYTYRYFELKNP
jgi:hypothetical protein